MNTEPLLRIRIGVQSKMTYELIHGKNNTGFIALCPETLRFILYFGVLFYHLTE